MQSDQNYGQSYGDTGARTRSDWSGAAPASATRSAAGADTHNDSRIGTGSAAYQRTPDTHDSHDRGDSQFNEAGQRIRARIDDVAETGKSRITSELRIVGAAAEAAAERLSEEDHERIGKYVRGITRQCEQAADYIQRKDIRGVSADLRRIARRNPAVFVGGAALLGIAAGRFLSAHPPTRREEPAEPGSAPRPSAYDPDMMARSGASDDNLHP